MIKQITHEFKAIPKKNKAFKAIKNFARLTSFDKQLSFIIRTINPRNITTKS